MSEGADGASERLILALDFPRLRGGGEVVTALGDTVGSYKGRSGAAHG